MCWSGGSAQGIPARGISARAPQDGGNGEGGHCSRLSVYLGTVCVQDFVPSGVGWHESAGRGAYMFFAGYGESKGNGQRERGKRKDERQGGLECGKGPLSVHPGGLKNQVDNGGVQLWNRYFGGWEWSAQGDACMSCLTLHPSTACRECGNANVSRTFIKWRQLSRRQPWVDH